ncbi:adenylate/guanylate cyclase domain-containing protein [Aeromicrobium sp. 9AM]|uniref:ATP-binding protein n=1 Tax=Aeromicrobium sp. 9AM TaxID=2653126 RepID=UPI0012EFECD7|nr:adenylate/guanylate cyclase domain-containing protein [Aeromicrobium sp. 9AM]VXB10344.1 conserved hypothetical protein [Aeromicrobium sp. 9AM]
MKDCGSCGTTGQPDAASFCFVCGSTLAAAACISCGSELPPGGKFCPTCGAAQDGAIATAVEVPQPKGSARKITSVLFGDLVGFTTLSENRDPEEVREMLTAYFDECRSVVGQYGGELEKFIGDAVMAVWGLPITREDDAERAVRAGLELVERVTALGERIGMPGLTLRVGITTAEVAVTLGATGQGMVAGDAVNTAARIQSTATPGEVWVDDTTRTFTSSSFAFDDAGAHALKGKAEPVPLWAVRAVIAGAGGDRRDDGLEAPLIGRDRELRLVKAVFHGVEESLRPGLLVVDGEAGVGKTRLGWEFEKYVDGFDAGVLWHRGRCLSYGDGIAYYALAEAVRGRLTILAGPDDAPDLDSRDVLQRGLDACVPDASERDWLAPRLAALLGQETGASFTREDLFVAWTTFFKYVGLREGVTSPPEPVVLVIDDAQYADEGLLDFLEHLLSAADYAVFVLVLARPELLADHHALTGNRRVTVVHLEPLSAGEMSSLLDDLVGGLPGPIRDQLVSRAAGVPLYALETVRSLIDQGLVVSRDGQHLLSDSSTLDLDALAAPTTLQALIAARLDTLPTAERRVVDRASVLGLVFTDEGIAALCSDVDDLDQALTGLFRREVLRRETDRLSTDYGNFRFVQGAVRQVAYGMLSRRDRKAAHLTVARTLGAELESRSDAYELAPIIAQHYLDALDAVPGDPDVPELTRAASEHLELAADRAAALGAPREAAGHLRRALARCEPDHRLAVLGRLAHQLRIAGDHAEAIEHAAEALEGFDASGEIVDAASAAEDLALALCYSDGDIARAEKAVRDQLSRLPQTPDDPALLGARVTLVRTLTSVAMRSGDATGLEESSLEFMRLAELAGDPRWIADSWTSYAISCAGALPRLSAVLLERAIELTREHRALREHSLALLNSAAMESYNDLPLAIERCREAIRTAHEMGDNYVVAFGELNLAQMLLLTGEWDEAAGLLTHEDLLAYVPIGVDVSTRLSASARNEVLHAVAETISEDSEILDDPSWRAEYELDLALEDDAAGRPEAPARALDSVRRMQEATAPAADFWPIWLLASEIARGHLDRGTIQQMLSAVEPSSGPWPAGVRAQRSRLQGVLGEDGSIDAEAVEAAYRDALATAQAWGSTLHEAHVRADLGVWLHRQGRVPEGSELVASARAFYERVGALRWLELLDRRIAAIG